jgi:hypothetical protein
MKTTYYILFERNHDPYGQKAVEVHDCLYDVECAQLYRQQDRADDYNKARAKAYRDGFAVSAIRTAVDYKEEFSIQQVTS